MDHRTDDPSRRGAKAALRDTMRDLWRTSDARSVEHSVTERIVALPAVASAATVAAYDALPGEIPLDLLMSTLELRSVRLLMPVLLADSSLSWRERGRAPLVDGRMGTRHPAPSSRDVSLAEADVVVVPGLAFDRHGRRLGRGGGSYDRALGAARADALLIGVAVDAAVIDEVPITPHDRPVHVVVTPTRVLQARQDDC